MVSLVVITRRTERQQRVEPFRWDVLDLLEATAFTLGNRSGAVVMIAYNFPLLDDYLASAVRRQEAFIVPYGSTQLLLETGSSYPMPTHNGPAVVKNLTPEFLGPAARRTQAGQCPVPYALSGILHVCLPRNFPCLPFLYA